MSFILRLTIAIIILFLLEFIFVKKLKNSFSHVFDNHLNRLTKWVIRIYLIFLNAFPSMLLLYWGYRYLFNLSDRVSIDNVFFDWLVIYPFWTLAVLTVQVFLFFILFDLLKFIVRFFANKERVKGVFLKLNFVLIIFFIFYVPARIIYDYNSVSVRITQFNKDNLPESLIGKKLALVGDLQADRYNDDARLTNFINKLNAIKPDLVLVTGDLITSTPDYIHKAAEMMSRIESPNGVLSCIGDHDNWAYRGDVARSRRELKAALDSVGIDFIHNENREILIDSSKIGITFVTHTYSEHIDDQKLEELTTNCKDCDLKIFLTHQPRQFLIDDALKHDYDMYLAGHTHGGQLSILFPFITLSPTLIETKYVRGDFFFDNMMVTVTRGLGMSIAPIRYNSTPEITVIVLGKNKIMQN